MKTIYLHVGAHKTGSTAVQSFFSLNREKLIKRGVLYPKFDHYQELPHHIILRPLVEPRINDHIWDFPHSEHIGSVDTIRNILNEEAEESQCDSLLISTEFLFVNKPIFGNIVCGANFAKYAKELFAGYKIKPIVYLRNQCDWIESCYVEAVKGAHTCYYGSFDEYFSENKGALDYRQYLEPWVKEFGEDLSVRCYEHYKKEGVEEDLINFLGFPYDGSEFSKVNRAVSNVGISKEGVEIIRAFNYLNSRRVHGDKYIFPYTNKELEEKGYFGKEGYLTKDQCQEIYDDLYDGNKEIEKLFSSNVLDDTWQEVLKSRGGSNERPVEMYASAELIKDLCESKANFDRGLFNSEGKLSEINSSILDNENKLKKLCNLISEVDKKLDSICKDVYCINEAVEKNLEKYYSLTQKTNSIEETIVELSNKMGESRVEKVLKLLGKKD